MVVDKVCEPKANGLCLSFLFILWVPIFVVLVYLTEGNPWAHLDQVANETFVAKSKETVKVSVPDFDDEEF